MRHGHCGKCPKHHACACVNIKDCPLLTAEMKRIERGRRKHNIEIIYQADMPEGLRRFLDNTIYGAYDGE